MWIKKLQIAIIEKDTDAIDLLINSMPKFENVKDIEAAMYLLRETLNLVSNLKDETSLTMKQLKKNIDFLGSTRVQTKNSLDLRF